MLSLKNFYYDFHSRIKNMTLAVSSLIPDYDLVVRITYKTKRDRINFKELNHISEGSKKIDFMENEKYLLDVNFVLFDSKNYNIYTEYLDRISNQ